MTDLDATGDPTGAHATSDGAAGAAARVDDTAETIAVAAPRTPPRRRFPTWVVIVGGVAIGAIIGLVGASMLSDRGNDDGGRVALQRADEATAADRAAGKAAFLDAWRRYRTATFTEELLFERVAANGQTLRSVSTLTQQPPRRILRQSDSVLLSAGADSLTCNSVNGQFTCAPGIATDYTADVEREIGIWQTALDGDQPYYVVSQPDDLCFQLDLVAAITDPPYGDVARFCFDEATGALAKRQIVRTTATDTEEATSISTVIPTDAFATPTTTR
jgi:hypothetical protein